MVLILIEKNLLHKMKGLFKDKKKIDEINKKKELFLFSVETLKK